jgi:hypothetical protein
MYRNSSLLSRIFTHHSAGLKPGFNMGPRIVNIAAGLLLFFMAGLAQADLLANDDVFGVPYRSLVVEPIGVFTNDKDGLNDIDPEADPNYISEVVGLPLKGTVACPNPDFGLGNGNICPDGSFSYNPGASFYAPDTGDGTDSFTYRFKYDDGNNPPTFSNIATVSLTACNDEGGGIFSCWVESTYRAKLAELGYGTFLEGFEGAEWDGVRTILNAENFAPSITSQGITWTTNHPVTNPSITTSSGAAVTSAWGVYDLNGGYATGTVLQCNTDPVPDPLPDYCLYHDGFRGAIQSGGAPLLGVGGYIHATANGGNVDLILNGTTGPIIKFGQLPGSAFQFLGVIDTTGPGFSEFEFQEQNSKVGQRRYIYGDNFIFATNTACGFATGYVIPDSQWTRFALPCKKTGGNNYTVEEVFRVLTPADYGVTWGVFSRDSVNQKYDRLNLVSEMSEGIGYWVWAENIFGPSSIANVVDVSGSPQSNVDIDLVGVPEGRDNYVGHNQDLYVDWNQVQVVDGNNVYNYPDYSALMQTVMYKWNGNTYIVYDGVNPLLLGTLDPFDAFWVHAFKPGIKLRIPVGARKAAVTNAAPASLSVASSLTSVESFMSTEGNNNKKAKKPKKPKNEPWYMRLTASAASMEDPGNVLGQIATATEGNDPHDLEEPAPFGSRYLSILFTNPLFEEVDWGFTTDLRPVTKNPQGVWPFVVKAYEGISEVTISWQGEDYLFEDAWLVDESNGEMIRAMPGESYTFAIEGGEHHFRFEVGK